MTFENFNIGQEVIIVKELVSLVEFFLINENKCIYVFQEGHHH